MANPGIQVVPKKGDSKRHSVADNAAFHVRQPCAGVVRRAWTGRHRAHSHGECPWGRRQRNTSSGGQERPSSKPCSGPPYLVLVARFQNRRSLNLCFVTITDEPANAEHYRPHPSRPRFGMSLVRPTTWRWAAGEAGPL